MSQRPGQRASTGEAATATATAQATLGQPKAKTHLKNFNRILPRNKYMYLQDIYTQNK